MTFPRKTFDITYILHVLLCPVGIIIIIIPIPNIFFAAECTSWAVA